MKRILRYLFSLDENDDLQTISRFEMCAVIGCIAMLAFVFLFSVFLVVTVE